MRKFRCDTVLVTIAFVIASLHIHAQSSVYGEFSGFVHVANPGKPGLAQYDTLAQEYFLEGSSGNMWFDRDDFHFLWKKIRGNFTVQAQVEFIGKGVEDHRKVGWMIRHSLEPNSPQVNAVVHGDGLTSIQFRRSPGGETEELKATITSADVIQLERQGNAYMMSVARFGEPFVTTQIPELSLGDEVYVGLFLCSHNEAVVEKARFRNVRIIIPPKEGYVPYRDYIGSHVETMEVENGLRKILYSEPGSLQAPNWTKDNRSLIYNADGKLFLLDLNAKVPQIINTDFATKNNNDHVLSFDGKMLAISHHSDIDGGASLIYTVPLTGGVPKKITEKGPSYLHGWSPDGKFLLYTGERNNEYDIYKIPASGGREIKLTSSKGLDDGSEFSPDGKYIYFNSVRSGRMQIWRMKPDGQQPEQLTFDEFNNWFPHISPDGKMMVFLSYQKEVAPDDHPFYHHVYIRMMPVSGGKPKIIAYVFGGQGTINVPSWSPDGKKIAFVSNTAMEKK
ncbi:MAG: biopolymer transporter TolR [Bacteroidota bacterium]